MPVPSLAGYLKSALDFACLPRAQGGLVAASVLLFSILGDTVAPFIYFQF